VCVESDADEAWFVVAALPALRGRSPVLGLVDAPLGVRFPCGAECGDIDDVRIRRVDDDTADVLCLLEAHEFPCEPAIGRLIYPAARLDGVSRVLFTRAGPDLLRFRWSDGERAHCDLWVVVEDGAEGHAGVRRL